MSQRVFPFCFFLFFALPAFADDPVDLGEIEVQDESLHESREHPSAFTTVIKPPDRDVEMRSAPELLESTVGVNATDLGGLGQLSTVSIRGSSSEQVVVFIDGVRINSAQGGGVDFASLPLDSIERIEVIRGGSSARFGSDAIGGVVNIVTKKGREQRSGDIRVTAGSFSTLQTSLAWHEPHPTWDLLVNHRHLSSAGDYPFTSATTNFSGSSVGNGASFTRIHNGAMAEDVLTKVTLTPTDDTHVIVSNDFHWGDRDLPGTEEETTLLAPDNPLEAHETVFRDASSAALNLNRFGRDDLAWEVGLTNLLHQSSFTDPSPASGDPIDVSFLNDSIAGSSLFTHTWDGESTSLASRLRYQYTLDLSADSSPIATTALAGQRTRQTHAAALEEEWATFDERLLFIPSIRVERASDRRARFSWKTGVIGKPWSVLDLKANVQSSHRYPSFDELYFPDQGYLRGNPDLDDETALGWDVGFIVHPELASLEVSYFQNRIDNSILFVPISATTIQPINTRRVDAQGLETTLTVTPADFFKASANYTLLDTHFASNGLGLPGRPRHKLNGRVEGIYRLATGYIETQYVSRYPINTANTVSLSERMTVNAGTTFRFAKGFFATLEAKDITDVQLYDARGFPLPRRSFWITVGATYGGDSKRPDIKVSKSED